MDAIKKILSHVRTMLAACCFIFLGHREHMRATFHIGALQLRSSQRNRLVPTAAEHQLATARPGWLRQQAASVCLWKPLDGRVACAAG